MFGGDGLRLKICGQALDKHDRVANLIGIEDVRRQGVAAPVAGAAVGVDDDAGHEAVTGKTRGSSRPIASAWKTW